MAVAFAALAGMTAFAPQASAQPVETTTTVQASPSSATVGQQVVLSATVSCSAGTPGGLGVTFWDGPEILDTVPLNASGNASLTTSFDTAGSYEITAAYNGDDNCGASSDTTMVQVSSAPVPPPAPPCRCGLLDLIIGDINFGDYTVTN
ncbi:Ig-like domain-containing protein [Saccharopolyspora sp. K220]|uniref:Ig-like domain-containing protein n=1 Tax=Saccharopolyspora soli TaxID=2926618 RepID=UPI001F5871D7|nr:Ig-like domain-containing protein [Saccharopolyspora soli]MCI2423490.1 Ig-like domain-containing protein [Saccharopolyspora soli]